VTTVEELTSVAGGLSAEDQERLLRFARALRTDEPGGRKRDRSFWENWARLFSPEDAREMAAAVEDCERIDEDAW
jgi:hypothetical protein